jgi:integrase
MRVYLTESAIRSAAKRVAETGQREDVSDTGEVGLRIRLNPAHLDPLSGTWVIAMRDPNGAMRRFTLGKFPAMGVSAARDAARAMRQKVKNGADPIAEAKRKRVLAKQARDGIGTLTALLDLYAKKKGVMLKTWGACRAMIDHVFQAHLGMPLENLRLGDLQMTADSHTSKQSAAAAVRYLRPVLKWAAHPGRNYVSTDLYTITPPATVARRDRVLSRDELSRLLPTLKASTRPYAGAMRLMLWTLARREEVAAMRWGAVDLDLGLWTISETKNGKPHVVPLPRQALALLRDLCATDEDGKLVKPGADRLVFATSTGERLANWDRETKSIMQASGTEGWTRHDLRRSGATMLGEMGELPNIIEAALNHVSIGGQLAATYNRSRYRPQVEAALQRLADALDGIEQGAGAVVPMRKVGA